MRRSLDQLNKNIQTDIEGRVFVEEKEIAVVYYRTGHQLEHYNEEEWEIRAELELSLAIKVPSVRFCLANMKII